MSKENPVGDQRDPGRGPTSSTPQPLVPPEPARESAVPSQAVSDAASEPARVLLLEDEAWDAEHARRLLTKAGMNYILVVVDALDEFDSQLMEFAPRALVGARQRLRLVQVEEQLTNAQRLASLGRLVAAEQEVNRMRQLLATIRSEIEANPAE